MMWTIESGPHSVMINLRSRDLTAGGMGSVHLPAIKGSVSLSTLARALV